MALTEAKQVPPTLNEQQRELLAGMRHDHKFINPKFFYDERGSSLFGEICQLPEYYPTRTEVDILHRHADSISAALGKDAVVIEPGAGNCEKITYLLTELQPAAYLPMDISEDYLMAAAAALSADFPSLPVLPLVADFARTFSLPTLPAHSRKVLFYPGSTIGNFKPGEAQNFLAGVGHLLGPGSGLLIGYDLHKEAAIINAAYNDKAGVTASFNRNILLHANTLLQADFDPLNFDHLAFYNEVERRIEMHLVSRSAHAVHSVAGDFSFAEGERIHTEYSYKYTSEDFSSMAHNAKYETRQQWFDQKTQFCVQYLVYQP